VGRPALILAALAADASPGKNFRHYLKVDSNPDVETLRLWSADGQSYEFKMPANAAGISELATEQMVVQSMRRLASKLPFEIPEALGQTRDSDGTTGVLFTLLEGSNPDLSRLGPGPFSKSFGEALAALHSLPIEAIADAGLPQYDSAAILQQKVAELDRMAATGKVPAQLLSRWEQALEDIGLFRFHATITHGALSSDAVMINGQQVVGLTNWNALSIGDPAEDFRWLSGGALPSTFEDAMLHYRAARPSADENFAQRAMLYSELELGTWLLHCLAVGDAEQIKQAEDLLAELKDNLEAGNLKDLTATSFVGLAVAAAIIPTATPTQEFAAIEVIEEAEELADEELTAASIFDEVAGIDSEAPAEGDQNTEPSPDELF
jgi:aminoglycoside phosphotransferase (APT) family kinase protein